MREVISFVIAFAVSAVVGRMLIPVLRALKAGQSIKEIGPSWHKSKQGTPTMGGLMFIIGIAAAVLAAGWKDLAAGDLGALYTLLFALVFGVIGFVDDYVKVKRHQNEGLTAPQKFLLQLAAAIAFTGTALHFTTVNDTHGGSVRILTASTDLDTVLEQADTPQLREHDRAVWTHTDDGEQLDVLRAYTVPITADGTTQEVITTGATTAELLAQAGLAWTEDDILSSGPDEIIPEGGSITLQRVSYVEYTQDEVIPAAVEDIPTSLFYRKQDKTMTLQEGVDGLDTVTYRETWIDGQWTATDEIDRVTQAGMVPTMEKVYGESAPVSQFVGPEIVDGVPAEGVAEVYTDQRSTGYSASETAKGASGRRLTYGTVAINPNIIPYGSLMYITSADGKFVYGYAYAADTGTAMMEGSAFIDLYYETYDESVMSAVIPVNVYVLDDETAAKYKEQNDAILAADTVVGR